MDDAVDPRYGSVDRNRIGGLGSVYFWAGDHGGADRDVCGQGDPGQRAVIILPE